MIIDSNDSLALAEQETEHTGSFSTKPKSIFEAFIPIDILRCTRRIPVTLHYGTFVITGRCKMLAV